MLNKTLYFVLAMAAVMLIGCSKQAPEINITDQWVRATAEGQEVGAQLLTEHGPLEPTRGAQLEDMLSTIEATHEWRHYRLP